MAVIPVRGCKAFYLMGCRNESCFCLLCFLLASVKFCPCLLYTSDAADDYLTV